MDAPLGQIWKARFEQTPAGASLTDRIVRMFLDARQTHVMHAGSPLPSSRELAAQIGVSRNTVVAALDRLVEQGVFVSRQRSGYFVNGGASRPVLDADPADALAELPAPHWEQRFVLRPDAQRNIAKPADWQNYDYPFIYGQIDPTLFPHAEWRECCERALRGQDKRELLADRIDRDDALLIEQVRTRLLSRRGLWARDSEILITVGAQHALFMIADLLVRPGMRVGVEDPGYPDARNVFALKQAQLRPLAVDEGGLKLSRSLRDCEMVYLTPSHQCPTTVTMPLERRRRLLQYAARHDIVLIEDDYEPESNHEGPTTPALKSLDLAGRVIYVGSLSKTLAPGIRLGYVVADAGLIAQLRALRRLMLRHPNGHDQRSLALFLAEGHYDGLARRMQFTFGHRARTLAAALQHHLPRCRIAPGVGGSACWLAFPRGVDATALAARLRAEGVLVEPGEVFHAVPERGRHTLRLGFSSIPAERIAAGIGIVARVLNAAERRPRTEQGLVDRVEPGQ